MKIANPYLDFFLSMPQSFWRNPNIPPDSRELWSPEWLRLKSAISRHFSWAVPTQEAIETIKRCTTLVIEIGSGSGYWAWLMKQAGIDVITFDTSVPEFAWHEVHSGTEAEVGRSPAERRGEPPDGLPGE